MAYEKMDKQALATMARDYERKSKPKVSFLSGLFASLGSSEDSLSINSNTNKSYSWSSHNNLAGGESEMTVAYHKRNSCNYSPMVGAND